MIHFPPLRTSRLDVQLQELTIAQAVDLAAVPPDKHEAAITGLLRHAVQEARGEHTDPARWTVQERILAVAHYTAATAEEGGNFHVGAGRLLDYLDAQADTVQAQADGGTALGHRWEVRQLIGAEAEAMEGICASRLDWVTADMAARLRDLDDEADGKAPSAADAPGPYADWLAQRADKMRRLPESDFADLFRAYRTGRDALHHIFRLEHDEQGHIVMPMKQEVGGQLLAPARFPVSACITELARQLCP